ncbi:hypothetical protein [Absidia glauca]|uniref:Galactose oxidase n=1 Tax=Absidia glauca TaxID=4829 RepID=A0A168LNK1_ABSGL|nr:hypothetical protein [Absidia glauca]
MKKRSLVLVALLIQLSLAIPSPRYKGGCVLVNKNKVYCAGGQSGPTSPTYQSDLYGLDLSHDYTDLNSLNNAWTTLAPLTEANSEFVMVPSGTNGFFINGGTGSANGKPLQYQSLVYNGATNTWTNLVAANATNSLAQAKGAVGTIDSLDLNDVYIWGGVLDASIGSVNTTYSGTFLVMNPTTGTWSPSLVKGTTPLGWTPRIGHAMLNSFSTISVFGGQEARYDTISRTYILSPASMSSIPQFDTILLAWRLANVTGDIPTPRTYHTVNSAGVFQALLYGGATPGTNTPVTDPLYQARLSGNSVEWTKLSVTGGPGPRFGHSAVTFGYNTVLVIGGVDTTGAAKSDVNVYSFSQKQWRTSFATSEFYSYTSNSPNGNSSSNVPPSGSSSSSYSGGSSPFALQQGIAGGIGAGGFVFLGLIGLGLYLAVEKKNKQTLVDHPLDPLTHGDGYTKIEVSPSIDDRPLPPAPAMQTGEAASYLQHHPSNH